MQARDMNAAKYRAMTADELDDELKKLKKEQFNLRFQGATGQLEGTNRIKEVRRTIARIKTLQNEAAAKVSQSEQGA